MPRVRGDSAEGPFQHLNRFDGVLCLHTALLSLHTVCGGLQAAAGAMMEAAGAMMEAAAAEVAEGAAEDAECPACVLPHLARDVSYFVCKLAPLSRAAAQRSLRSLTCLWPAG